MFSYASSPSILRFRCSAVSVKPFTGPKDAPRVFFFLFRPTETRVDCNIVYAFIFFSICNSIRHVQAKRELGNFIVD